MIDGGMTYAESGVDIERGDRFARFIAGVSSRAVSRSIGGFSGGLDLDLSKYTHPVLLSTTDGVGTKILVARRLGKFDTIGIDLVAMNVNDLAVCGADPLAFLDYIACGRIDETLLRDIIKGIVAGCEEADTTLVGGETAEMPDLYNASDFDLAGFSTGLVDRDRRLPKTEAMAGGDPIFGLESTGVHSNGMSLARKALAQAPAATWEELLIPTKIYVRELRTLLDAGLTAAAHITGGGLMGNLIRVLPPSLRPDLTWDWPVPEIFARIKAEGRIEEAEMRRVFNLGIGVALVVSASREADFLRVCRENGITAHLIGRLTGG